MDFRAAWKEARLAFPNGRQLGWRLVGPQPPQARTRRHGARHNIDLWLTGEPRAVPAKRLSFIA